jgi:hypothetical protein
MAECISDFAKRLQLGTQSRMGMCRLALCGVLVGLVLTGCQGSGGSKDAARVQVPYLPSPGAATLRIEAASGPVSVGSEILCRTTDDQVTVTSVVPTGSVNLVVDAFALRPNPAQSTPSGEQLVAERRSLSAVGNGFTPGVQQILSGICDQSNPTSTEKYGPNWQWDELGVQYSKIGSGNAWDTGIDVHYTNSDGEQVFHLPLSVAICQNSDSQGPCAR